MLDPARAIRAGEIHLWATDLDAPRRLEALSADERERARRFHFDRDRRRSMAARAALRDLLSAYIHSPPQAIRFVYGPRGKPSLANGKRPVHFNVSHAGPVGVYAVACDEVGVDIEVVRPTEDLDAVARRYFSPLEVATLMGLPEDVRPRAFFDCWTRKEAYIKAIGEGLACPLAGFDVAFAPGDGPRMLGIGGDSNAAARWSLCAFDTRAGYAAAAAIEVRAAVAIWCGWL